MESVHLIFQKQNEKIKKVMEKYNITEEEAYANKPNIRLKEMASIRIYEDDRIRDLENLIRILTTKVVAIQRVLAKHCEIMEKFKKF